LIGYPQEKFRRSQLSSQYCHRSTFQRYYQLLHSKKAKFEESKPEINASDQKVRQENKEDEISDDNVSGIQDSGDQIEDTCTLKDSVVIETDECDSESDDVEVNVANQDEDEQDPIRPEAVLTVFINKIQF
jgi:hypothetical protein